MQNIDSYDFNGKKAIVRVDFNVPLDADFNITDDTRIRAAIPTLKKVLAGGGSLIIMSHLGKPKGPAEKFSLKHIIGRIEELLGTKVQFAPDCMKADEQAAALKPGEVLLLENLRFYAEEEGKPRGLAEDATEEEKKAAKAAVKESQKKFTEHLASYADCYINDAFGTAHRAHASTALIAKYFPNDKMFGYVMEGEIKAIDKVLGNPQRPLTVILGGAKVSSKLGVIEHLLDLADNMIIGGGMVYTFMKAQGGTIGTSLVEDDQLQTALDTLAKAKEKGVKLYFSILHRGCGCRRLRQQCAHPDLPFERHSRRMDGHGRLTQGSCRMERGPAELQDHTLERPRRRIRDAQLRPRHQHHCRDSR